MKKSIAILGSRGIPAGYGGFETFAEELSTRLVSLGVDVTVYCEATEDGNTASEYRGVRLVHLPVRRLGPLTTILFDARCLWHARKGHDVVYMLGYGAALFCFIPRIWGSSVWINMDGIEWVRSKWSRPAKLWLWAMEFVATKAATTVVADATGIEEHLRSRHGSRVRIAVVAYGAHIVDERPEPGVLNTWGLSSGSYYLVVCRLEPENHVEEIVEGYLASGSLYPLVVVGDIDAPTPYAARLREIRSEGIIFLGTVFDRVKLECLRWHCRAYFHGHSVGGTNPSLLEALGCGNRIVAHDNKFNREVASGCADFFYSPADIPAIIENLDSKEPDAESRENARGRIKTQYSWPKIAQSYLSMLQNK